MKKRKTLFIIICFLLINNFTQFSVFSKDIWKQVKTNNFTLIGNVKENKIKKVGIKLEQFRESIKRLVPDLSKDSPISKTVIVFKNNKSFRPYKLINSKGIITEWVTGYFQAGFDIDYIVLTFETTGSDPFQTIFHEYTHNLIDYNYGRKNIPTWFNEGMSEYYDQLTVRKDRIVSIGGNNKEHIKLLKQNGLLPLENLFKIDHNKLRTLSQENANLFYAQSWAIFHYFMRAENGRRKKHLDKFIKLLLRDAEPEVAFKEAFQMSYGEFATRLLTYIETGGINANITEFDTKLTAETETKTKVLTQAEVQAHLGDLLYQRERFADAEKHLLRAIELDPNLSLANSTLGMLYLRQQKFGVADKYLSLAVKSNYINYLTYYRYSYFLSREVMSSDNYISNYSDERTLLMRDLLQKSISLNPNFPESYRLQAFINLVRNERFAEGIIYLKKAIELTPNNDMYSIHLAQIYLRNKEFENAITVAENIVKNTNDRTIKKTANEIIQRVNLIKNEIADARTKKIENPTNKPSDTSAKALTEQELERNRKQTLSDLINEVLRKPKFDEERIVGQISEVQCSANILRIKVNTENQIQVLQRNNLKGLLLLTYTSKMSNGLFGCGEKTNNISAVLTYKPNIDKSGDFLGEVVSIEFVPDDFELASHF